MEPSKRARIEGEIEIEEQKERFMIKPGGVKPATSESEIRRAFVTL